MRGPRERWLHGSFAPGFLKDGRSYACGRAVRREVIMFLLRPSERRERGTHAAVLMLQGSGQITVSAALLAVPSLVCKERWWWLLCPSLLLWPSAPFAFRACAQSQRSPYLSVVVNQSEWLILELNSLFLSLILRSFPVMAAWTACRPQPN